jgi:hypothetical protein
MPRLPTCANVCPRNAPQSGNVACASIDQYDVPPPADRLVDSPPTPRYVETARDHRHAPMPCTHQHTPSRIQPASRRHRERSDRTVTRRARRVSTLCQLARAGSDSSRQKRMRSHAVTEHTHNERCQLRQQGHVVLQRSFVFRKRNITAQTSQFLRTRASFNTGAHCAHIRCLQRPSLRRQCSIVTAIQCVNMSQCRLSTF